MAFALLMAGHAWALDAGHARALNFDPCVGLTGQAKGLCTKYTVDMRCSADVPNATPEACANVATMLEEVTGFPPPSDCPCNFSLAGLQNRDGGWNDGPPYECKQGEDFDRSNPPSGVADGNDITLLKQRSDRASMMDFEPRALAELTAADIRVGFTCSFGTPSMGPGFQSVSFTADFFNVPGRGDMVAGFIHKYEACKGAIGILVANFPLDLPINECLFD